MAKLHEIFGQYRIFLIDIVCVFWYVACLLLSCMLRNY